MAYTKRILSNISDPELKKDLHLVDGDPENESRLRWILDKIDKIKPLEDAGAADKPDHPPDSYQQSDLLRNFYLLIAEKGLAVAYKEAKFTPGDLPSRLNIAGVTKKKPVIIVGAGMSGLVAAYELKKANYNVEILEMCQRFGGRVKTLDQKDGFDRGLHSDAGAMRLPLPPNIKRPVNEMIHYLTDYYASKVFKIEQEPFKNSDDNAFYHFYGVTTKISDWDDKQFNEYWPHWNDRLIQTKQTHITSIGDYYEATVSPVIQLLKNRLKRIPKSTLYEQAKQWDLWTNNWCQFSLGSFLRSNLCAIKSLLLYTGDDKINEDDVLIDELDKYLPWPEPAITAYTVFTYTLNLDVSLVSVLQDEMGKWWSSNMHSLKGGLSALPKAFASSCPNEGGKDGDKDGDKDKETLETNITYNRTVTKVEYIWLNNQAKSVKVHGVITSSGVPFCIEGRSVIITVPLHVLRGIEIVNGIPLETPGTDKIEISKPFPTEYQQAIQDISYSPSTKIMLQYKKQFWRTTANDITGGFSKTNLPVGQLHYPTEVTVNVENLAWENKPIVEDQKGILMVYTWKAEALMWGALTEEAAIRNAVQQIDAIHPGTDNTKELFEVGKRQAWASDPTTLGAFAMLRPNEYVSVLYLMQNSWRNVYFAGEAISFANGWIQGALESGLRAAFQLYADDV